MNNRWRHKINLRRKYKKKKKPKVRIMDWGDLLAMPGLSPQEIWDEFDKYMKSKEGDIDDRDYAILRSMHEIGNITHVQFNLGIPTIKKLNDKMHGYKNSIKCLRGVKKVVFHSNDYMEYIYNKHHKKNK